MTVFDVSLSDAFVNKLRQSHNHESSTSPVQQQDPASLTLRFSVPPDTLEGHKSELELRRTTRGEFTLQQAGDTNVAREQGQGQGQGAAGPPGPTFKGPATVASDVECVLVYNPQSEQYELHPIGLDIQMAPALKPRTKPSSSAGAKSVLREPPANSKPALSRQPPVRPAFPGPGSGSNAGSVPASGASSPTIASPNLGASPGPSSQPHHPTAMLPPRRATTARLPTRRTMKKSVKPVSMHSTPVASRSNSVEADPSSQQRQISRSNPPSAPPSAQHTPRSSPHKRSVSSAADPGNASKGGPPATPRIPVSETFSAAPSSRLASNAHTAKPAEPVRQSEPEQRLSAVASPTLVVDDEGADDSRFDDDLDDLADELADELGEDDDNPTPAPMSSAVGIGTALSSMDDGEDTSEEE